MNDIPLFPADIAAMSVSQLAALPAAQKAEIDKNLDEALDWLKKARSKFDAALDAAYGEQARTALRTLFPPAVGKSAHFDVPSINEFVWRISYTMKGRQTLTVPAGRFEAWLIEYEQRGVVGNTFLGRQTFALADNGMIIRREGTVVRGRAPAGSGFVTPPAQAVSIRVP